MATVIWYSNPTSGNAMNWTDSNQWNQADDGSGTAGNPDSTDDKAVIQSGDTVTLDGNVTTGQCAVEGTLTGNASYSLTLAGSDQDNNFTNSGGTVTNLNLIMTGIRASGDRSIIDSGSGIRDLTINDTTNSGNNVHALGNNLSISGDLTITSGTLDTQFSSTDRSLTVAGTTQVTGTLTCNSSAISLGTGLTSGWGLDIQSGGTFTGGSGTHTIGSIFAAGGGTRTITLSSGATTIDSKNTGNGYSINLASGATFNHGSGTVTMTYAGNTLIQLSGGTLAFNTFTYNASGRTLELRSPMSCAANLTLTAGTLDTKSGTNHALTVTGKAYIGPNDGTSDTATLTCNASDISIGSGYTADYSLMVVGGGTFVGGSGTHTLGSIYQANAAGAKITLSSGTTNINAEYSSGNYAINILGSSATFNHGGGTVLMNYSGTTYIREDNSTLELNDLTINHGSADVNTNSNLTCAGDVTITAGILDTEDDTISFGSLTIASGATYDATSGTTEITSAASNYAISNAGTFTHNDGTVTITGGSNQWLHNGPYYNLISNNDSSIGMGIGANITVANDLTVNASKNVGWVSAGNTLTVTGDVIVNGYLNKYNSSTVTADLSFGSLTIASGGTYYATSGTTTITDQTGGGYGWNNAGTFTHNNGKVTFTDNLNPYIIESTFYDMEINLAQNTSELRSDDIGGAGFTILNDLTITRGRFKFNTAGDSMTVHGLTKLETNGQFGLNSPSGTHTFNGLVTVNGGTWFLSSGTNNMAGIRNVGGTIS